jgi:hypothetical protein
MKPSKIAESTQVKRWLRSTCVSFAVVAALLMFGSTQAMAGCGAPGNLQRGGAFKPTAFALPGVAHNSVVGFWHVRLTLDSGAVLLQSTVQYHPDGTEQESALLPVLGGNFCMGVWKEQGGTVQIYHIAWFYGTDKDGNPGMPVSYGVMRQTNTLSAVGSEFRGHFTLIFHNLNGTQIKQVQGTTLAFRIDSSHTFTVF